jgi:7-cyano-7-deazaguanine synthase in queuosine biosynthesis
VQINIEVSPSTSAYEFAKVTIMCPQLNIHNVLDIEFSRLLRGCGRASAIVTDLLFLSSVVYVVDKIIPRDSGTDFWTRVLELNLPVSDPTKWNRLKQKVENCLSFLTGDIWHISFLQFSSDFVRPLRNARIANPAGDAVCLFSGGLDSLVGAIDWLEYNKGSKSKVLLVGHHDNHIHGPLSQQRDLFRELDKSYKGWVNLLQVRVGTQLPGLENTYRSRSLLFIALGIYAAATIGDKTPLLIPENGTIALNVPLTPSRRGSCSTRTAHPFFLDSVRDILSSLGIKNGLINPLKYKTKGESVEQCNNRTVLKTAAPHSVSCARGGHRANWLRSGKGCGWCMPCIYRRAALNKIGCDTEPYGRDICNGEVDLDEAGGLGEDLRDCVSFLQKKYSMKQLAALLLTNGILKVDELPQYAEIVARSMDEIRALLQKAPQIIKRRAGIIQ